MERKEFKEESNKRNKVIIGAILAILIICGFIVYNMYRNMVTKQAFNKSINTAEKYFAEEKYNQAVLEYEKALSYKQDSSIKKKIQLSKELDTSMISFINANSAFEKKAYMDARNYFTNVSQKDTKRYTEAQSKIIQCTQLFFQNEFMVAKENASKNNFIEAISHINAILAEDNTNKEAIALISQYKIAQSNKEKKEAEAERQRSIAAARRIIRVKKLYSDRPNYAGGVDFNIIWTNNSSKTIKYITFEVVPYNAVGDKQTCEIRGNSNFYGKVTGPIKPGVTHGYGSVWECAWYNNTIVKIELVCIEIEYMDGTTESLDETQCCYVKY